MIYVAEFIKKQYPDYEQIIHSLPSTLIGIDLTPIEGEIRLEFPDRNIYVQSILFEDTLALGQAIRHMLK